MSAANSALFAPIKVGKNELKHRVVLAPLTRFRATPKAVPTDLQVEHYKQRATEGGLLITEATYINRLAGSYPQAPGIYTKEQIEAWKKVTEAVHEKKGVIYLQLWHVGRAGLKSFNPNQEQIVSASDIPISGKNMFGVDHEVPRPLTVDEIKAIVQDYRQAALNAIEAGFDGVEIHGANGYLIDQFINSGTNKRTDQYGGSIENRARFAFEVIDAIAGAIGADRTAIRFSPGGSFQDMHDDTVVETWSYLTSQLQQNHPDLAYLHFIEARANFLNDETNSADTLEPYRQIWKGPFVAASGFSTNIPHAIETANKTGNLIAFGRAFIANPDLPERIRNGWELNKYDRSTFYTYDPVGYNDYPFYDTKN
ncbi:12-oxophytodienoate reductase 1 [Choanephora cucurbitarum]|uniref:12-oxophytodienoate reductase 1 n=1 Tax=Choanephora cucurbitarum TaxID=101091 RepID=A0A1C7NEJ2_9FUNG|nr:12-oxophytodienoate reductase 1 [Choanephora cucurbitarum]